MREKVRPSRKVSCSPTWTDRGQRARPTTSGGGFLRLEEGDAPHGHAVLARRTEGRGDALSRFPAPLVPAAALVTNEVEHHVSHLAATVSPIEGCRGDRPPTAA